MLAIEPTKAPDGRGDRDWFCYRILQGSNLIRGYRRGTLADVTKEVDQIVSNLNERRMLPRGRVDLRTKKPPPKTQPPATREDS